MKQASHHPGGFTGRGRAHSRKKGGCPPAGLSFLPFCVSVRPSVWAPHLSTCLSHCSLEPCPSVCSSVWVCLCVCPPSWACPSAYVCLPAHLCVSVRGAALCVAEATATQAGGESVLATPSGGGPGQRVGRAGGSPAAGSSAGPPRRPPGRGPWCLLGEGPCTEPPRRACPPAGGGVGPECRPQGLLAPRTHPLCPAPSRSSHWQSLVSASEPSHLWGLHQGSLPTPYLC